MERIRPLIRILLAAASLSGVSNLLACRVDEVTFGVGNARVEDSFGNPVMRPYAEEDSLRLYRFEIERKDPDRADNAESETSAPPIPDGD